MNKRRFLYLVQSPSGDYVGPKNDDCDILSLTYETKRPGSIFFPNSTWATGRNRLYQEAQALPPYDYYLFMDDDIQWVEGSFEQFQNKLLEHQPVYAGAFWDLYYSGRGMHFQSAASPVCVMNYDPILAAFKREAMPHLLPYVDHFDQDSWWAAQTIMIHKLYLLYPGRSALFLDCSVANELHRSYPKEHDRKKIDRWCVDVLFAGNKAVRSRFIPADVKSFKRVWTYPLRTGFLAVEKLRVILLAA